MQRMNTAALPNTHANTLSECEALDRHDDLRSLRELFQLPEGVIYLDGNSLGVLPKTAPARVAHAVTHEWGHDLIKSWNSAGWFTLPQRVGDKIARIIGAQAGEVIAADSTSINLFKVLAAALNIAKADHPHKTKIVSERSNFPTDLYIAEEIFCVGTAAEVSAINSVDDRRSPCPGPITKQVADNYGKAVRGQVAKYKHWCELAK